MSSNQPKSDHKCDICGNKYRYEGHLVKHKRIDHKPKDPTIDPDAEAEKDCCDSWFCNCFLHCMLLHLYFWTYFKLKELSESESSAMFRRRLVEICF